MPAWKMPVAASHVTPIAAEAAVHHAAADEDDGGEENTAAKSYKKAGFPDLILYSSPKAFDQSAILEVKTYWAYPRKYLDKMTTSEVLTNNKRGHHTNPTLPPDDGIKGQGGGYFDWRLETVAANILKQVRVISFNSIQACIKNYF